MCAGTMVFVFNRNDNWKTSTADDWDLQSVELDGSEEVLGHKKIDGAICKIVKMGKQIVAIPKSN